MIKAVRGRGLYETTDPAIGKWTSWEPLPRPDTTDPALRLAAEATPKPVAVSLYEDDTIREDQRRRKANAALEKAPAHSRCNRAAPNQLCTSREW